MATLNLVAGAHVFLETRRGHYYECCVFNTNVADGEYKETFAVAYGSTEEQARRRARQIVSACDGAEA